MPLTYNAELGQLPTELGDIELPERPSSSSTSVESLDLYRCRSPTRGRNRSVSANSFRLPDLAEVSGIEKASM